MSLNLERKLYAKPKREVRPVGEVVVFKNRSEEVAWRIEKMAQNPVRSVS